MFCKIYVAKSRINGVHLLASISALINEQLVNHMYVEKSGYYIDINANDEYDKEKEKEFPDGFLYFPFSIEIDIQNDIRIEDAAREVSCLLKYLWENNYAAVAACDFEDQLPEKGGYKSKNIPWPAGI